MKNLIVISGLVVALATGSSVAQAGPGQGGGNAGAGAKAQHGKSQGKSKGASKRCAKVRKVGFVVAGTFVRGDATSVTLKVTRANRHATKSGLVTVGKDFTATSSRIRYVNRTGPGDAQATDKVKVVGKVTQLKRKCSTATTSFTPVATIRSVKVKGPDAGEPTGPDAGEPTGPDAVEPSEPEVPGGEAGI